MQSGEYFWIKAKTEEGKRFGEEWQPGQVHEDGEVDVCGADVCGQRDDFEIGPKVIGPDELVVSSLLYREALEGLRDRFAMAALAAHVGDFQIVYATTMTDALAEKCYSIADAMMEVRKK